MIVKAFRLHLHPLRAVGQGRKGRNRLKNTQNMRFLIKFHIIRNYYVVYLVHIYQKLGQYDCECIQLRFTPRKVFWPRLRRSKWAKNTQNKWYLINFIRYVAFLILKSLKNLNSMSVETQYGSYHTVYIVDPGVYWQQAGKSTQTKRRGDAPPLIKT